MSCREISNFHGDYYCAIIQVASDSEKLYACVCFGQHGIVRRRRALKSLFTLEMTGKMARTTIKCHISCNSKKCLSFRKDKGACKSLSVLL